MYRLMDEIEKLASLSVSADRLVHRPIRMIMRAWLITTVRTSWP